MIPFYGGNKISKETYGYFISGRITTLPPIYSASDVEEFDIIWDENLSEFDIIWDENQSDPQRDQRIYPGIENIIENVVEEITDIENGIKNGIKNVVEDVVEEITGIENGLKNVVEDFVKDLTGSEDEDQRNQRIYTGTENVVEEIGSFTSGRNTSSPPINSASSIEELDSFWDKNQSYPRREQRIYTQIENVVEKITGMENVVEDIVDNVSEFIGDLTGGEDKDPEDMDGSWKYTGSRGIEYWGTINPNCLGQSQSPINMDRNLVEREPAGQNGLNFVNYDKANSMYTKLENNGHSLELHVHTPTDMLPTLSGGHLTSSYSMAQLHWHWGSNDYIGSEHTINRRRFPIEMHLVHLAFGEGSSVGRNSLAVAGFVFQIVQEDNPHIQGIVEMIDSVIHAHTEVSLRDAEFNVDRLIRPSLDGEYYNYDGSLTTPGCDEIVSWILFKEPLNISSRQLAKFRMLLDNYGDPIVNNFRPIQPLNDRTVTLYT